MNTFCPTDKEAWRIWLKKNHLVEDSIWLIIHKKGSPTPNLTWSEAVDEALCFGWIDSTRRGIDKEKYQQYFCKRKAKSNWSKINKDKVSKLIEQGLMAEEGHKSIEIAKENGSWTKLDAIEALVTPEDLKEAFADHKGSMKYYDGLSKSVKKILLHWVSSAKRTETRQKRIMDIAEHAGNDRMPNPFRYLERKNKVNRK